MIIRTATGKEYPAITAEIGSISGDLGILLSCTDIKTAFVIFSKTAETITLTRDWDGVQTVYEGYTKLTGVITSPRGVMVTLQKEANHAE